MRRVLELVRRRPDLALVALAVALAAAIYAPTLGRGLINLDDTWLVRDNVYVRDASWGSLRAIWLDLDSPKRFVLSPEYLPIRDMSVMLDYALWGDWYPGFHVTNLVVYAAAIAIWFVALVELGVERTVAALAVLVWAVHPSHAESVAWLSERKGLLGALFSGACALGYAKFRAGAGARWLVIAAIAAAFAVWSKAQAAFAIAALAGLELALPARRASWRRSAIGLGAIAAIGAAAFVPVLVLAARSEVIGTGMAAPAGRLAMALGTHGFYLELGALALRDAVSYPIASDGPSAIELAIGALGLVAVIAALARGGPVLRAAAVLWLFGWLPVSHLVLPLQMVFVADRYVLLPSLGLALAVAFALSRAPPRVRAALAAAIVVAASARALDAQASWASPRLLWERAVASNPHDCGAWSMYASALDDDGERALGEAAVARGLELAPCAALHLRAGLFALGDGNRAEAYARFQRAADDGDVRAMANLAYMLFNDHRLDDALAWARRAVAAQPLYASGQRARGKVALALGRNAEALAAFEQALALEPANAANRYNLALARRAVAGDR